MPATARASALIELHNQEGIWLWGITFETQNLGYAHPPTKNSNREAPTQEDATTAAISSMQSIINANHAWMMRDPTFKKDVLALARIQIWLTTIRTTGTPLFNQEATP